MGIAQYSVTLHNSYALPHPCVAWPILSFSFRQYRNTGNGAGNEAWELIRLVELHSPTA